MCFYSKWDLSERATGEELFHKTDEYMFQNELHWNSYVSVNIDRATSMTGEKCMSKLYDWILTYDMTICGCML